MAARAAAARALGPVLGVVGAGHVGAAVAHTAVLSGTAGRVVLLDRHRERAEGEAWDIGDSTPLLPEAEIAATDDYRDLAEAEVVVVTVGATVTVGQPRLAVLADNVGLIRTVMRELDRAAPDAVVLLATNPVDVLTRVAIEGSSRPEPRVLGAGTVVDTARLRYQLAAALGADDEDVHAHVLGEHGDSQFVAWSVAAVGAIPLAGYPLPAGADLARIKADCEAVTRGRGREIHARKGFTSYGIAAAVCRIAGAVLRDERRALTVSAPALPDYGLGAGAVLGLPCVVGRAGLIRRLHLALDADERARLARSAAVLDEAYASIR